MATPPKSIGKVRLDVFQALKRGLMRRGVAPAPKAKPLKPAAPAKAAGPSSDGGDSDDSAPKQLPNNPSLMESAKPSDPSQPPEGQEAHERLIDITEKAQDVLFKADTVFPFTLFPDTITLDREKLTVATRSFFRIAKIVSVPVSSISSAETDVGPFFGSLHLASKYFVQNIYSVNFLPRQRATKLQYLLQGFIIAQEKNIDVTDIEKSDLLVLLADLGQGVSD